MIIHGNWGIACIILINSIPVLQNDRMVEVDTDHCRSSNPAYSKTRLPRTMTKNIFNIFKDEKYTSSLGSSTVTEKQPFSCVQKEFHVFWFMIIASCPVTVYHWLKSSYVFFFSSSYVFIHIDKIPWAFLFPGCSVLALSASPQMTEASVPYLSSPSLDSLQYVLISLVQGDYQSLHVSYLHWVEGKTHHLWSAGSTPPNVSVCLGHCWLMGSLLPPRSPRPYSAKLLSSLWAHSMCWCMEFFLPHAGLLNCIRFPSAHSFSMSRSLWITVQTYSPSTTLPRFVSSANLLAAYLIPSSSRSLMKVLNSIRIGIEPIELIVIQRWWLASSWTLCRWSLNWVVQPVFSPHPWPPNFPEKPIILIGYVNINMHYILL